MDDGEPKHGATRPTRGQVRSGQPLLSHYGSKPDKHNWYRASVKRERASKVPSERAGWEEEGETAMAGRNAKFQSRAQSKQASRESKQEAGMGNGADPRNESRKPERERGGQETETASPSPGP